MQFCFLLVGFIFVFWDKDMFYEVVQLIEMPHKENINYIVSLRSSLLFAHETEPSPRFPCNIGVDSVTFIMFI